MKEIFSIILSVILSLFGLNTDPYDLQPLPEDEITLTQEQIALFEQIVEGETAWLASLQLENGAIPMTYTANGTVKMNPYFADFAALALLERSDVYAENVTKYMDWHFSRLNSAETDYNGVDGTIYDYTITLSGGKITEESVVMTNGHGTYDSTDSYAATFLTVLAKYYEKTNDTEYILSHKEEINRITNAMFSTLRNGLTSAKPDYGVKFLMDNCEVYEGVVAATVLFEEVICPADNSYNGISEKCSNTAEEIRLSIENKLWNPVGQNYKTGIRRFLGVPERIFSWSNYYPSATAQLFPIICGVIQPNTQRARNLYNRFSEEYDWVNFDYPDDFYWGANALAAAKMADVDRVTEYMTNYAVLMETHAYPLYNADAARACLAANLMLENYA